VVAANSALRAPSFSLRLQTKQLAVVPVAGSTWAYQQACNWLRHVEGLQTRNLHLSLFPLSSSFPGIGEEACTQGSCS